jgi:hypothetical protein
MPSFGAYLIDLLIILSIILIFIIEITGIRNGLAMSKQNMLSEIKFEMEKIEPLYDSLMNSIKIDSYSKLYGVILTRENLSRKYKDIEDINEWMFNPESMTKIALTSIATIIIPLARIIFSIKSII